MIIQIAQASATMWAMFGKNVIAYKRGKEDEKTFERVSQWKTWFNQACSERVAPAEIIMNENSVYGNHAQSFGSVENWLANDQNMMIAYTLFIDQNPGLSVYKNNCPNVNLYFGLIAGSLFVLILVLYMFKNSK